MNPNLIPALSHEIRQGLCALIAGGLRREAAAGAFGFDSIDLQRLVAAYPEFSDDILRAERNYELTQLRNIADAGAKHWHAAAWLLERRFPGRYGKRRAASVDLFDAKALVARLADIMRAMLADDPVRIAELESTIVSMWALFPDDEPETEGPLDDEE